MDKITVSDEPLFRNHLYKEYTDIYGSESYCGKTLRNYITDDITEEISKTTCYDCLDIVVQLGKECAERLTELPVRYS
jgi:hypothetical protein